MLGEPWDARVSPCQPVWPGPAACLEYSLPLRPRRIHCCLHLYKSLSLTTHFLLTSSLLFGPTFDPRLLLPPRVCCVTASFPV